MTEEDARGHDAPGFQKQIQRQDQHQQIKLRPKGQITAGLLMRFVLEL
jgi:hypothetical protein